MARDLMSDEEWAFFERFIFAVRAPNGRKPTNHRLVLDGIFWIARTGAPWRDLPAEFGKWSSVYRQFRRWTLAGLTQSTVSRLLQTLEQQMGQPLFVRRRRRLIPTDGAVRYHADISAALDLIQQGGMSLIANPEGGSLDLALLPTFGTRWLAPRLPRFMARHPGIMVNLTTRFQPVSFGTDPFDAAITYHQGEAMQDESLHLLNESLTACASPGFLAEHPIKDPDDLKSLVLLRLQTRPDAWTDWFEGQGVQAAPSGGMIMDQFSMMTQAAISGLGVALLPDYLARQEIAEGHLLPVLRPAVPGRGAYFLVWPKSRSEARPLVHFRDWLAKEVA